MQDEVVKGYYDQVQGARFDEQQGGYIYPCDSNLPDLGIVITEAYTANIPGNLMTFNKLGRNSNCEYLPPPLTYFFLPALPLLSPLSFPGALSFILSPTHSPAQPPSSSAFIFFSKSFPRELFLSTVLPSHNTTLADHHGFEQRFSMFRSPPIQRRTSRSDPRRYLVQFPICRL